MQPPTTPHHGRRALFAAPLVGLLSLGAMAVSLPQALAAEADESSATTSEQQAQADPDTPGRDGSHTPGDAAGHDETGTDGEARAEAEGEAKADDENVTDDETEAREEGDRAAADQATVRADADGDEATLHARLVVLVGSGDVTAVIALLQDLDAHETDGDAAVASLDAVLAQVVTAIETGTYDTTVAGELLVAIRSSSTYGAELERRIEAGTLHATLVAALEGDATSGTPGQDEDDTDDAAPAPAPTASPSPTASPTPAPTATAPTTGGQVETTVTTSGSAGDARTTSQVDARTTAQVAGEQLPMTGMDALQLALLALAALGIGAAALVATRRSTVAQTADDR